MATKSVSKLQKGWAASRSRAANLAKKIADPARKVGTTALACAGGAGAGQLHKWAANNGKDITFGDTKATYGMAGGAALAALGIAVSAKGGKGGTEAGYALHGLGTGMLAGELALLVRGTA